MKSNFTVRKLCILSALSALSIVFALLIRFPIFPAASYLEFDAGDVPILIGTFLYGPLTGVLLTIVTSLIQGMTVSAASGFWGIVMHILATGAFCLCAGLIYQARPKRNFGLIGLFCGLFAATLIMIPANLLITPIYTGAPREFVAGMLLPFIIPFNLIKCGINGLVTAIAYPPILNLFRKWWGANDVF